MASTSSIGTAGTTNGAGSTGRAGTVGIAAAAVGPGASGVVEAVGVDAAGPAVPSGASTPPTVAPGVVPPAPDIIGVLQTLATLIRQQSAGEMRSTKAMESCVQKMERFAGREVSRYLLEYRHAVQFLTVCVNHERNRRSLRGMDILEPSMAPYSRWFTIPKKNGSLRFIQDLQPTNSVIIRNVGTWPVIDDVGCVVEEKDETLDDTGCRKFVSDHNRDVGKILNRLREVHLTLSGEKSRFGVPEILVDDETGVRFVTRFGAKILAGRRRDYPQMKRELWGVYTALRTDRDFLIAASVLMETECLPQLGMITICSTPYIMMLRWIAYIRSFNPELKHIAKKENVVAKMLSRSQYEKEEEMLQVAEEEDRREALCQVSISKILPFRGDLFSGKLRDSGLYLRVHWRSVKTGVMLSSRRYA
ncbi:hypothetical protein R1sor_014392 [Riccia sorocarpa]|uniref:Reverse transcriptase RNase H-like domain-containing protein n=1 Tax=Riccia sorocarpa TaxID=122646 RepID=A0ABD3H995_9MARC